MAQLGRVGIYQDNVVALGPPTVNNDATQGYGVGSTWYDTTNNVFWQCASASAGASIWRPVTSGVVGSLIGANMNVTTDQVLTGHIVAGVKYSIGRIIVTNCAVSLTTAAGGVYGAAAKGNPIVVAASQVYTALTGTVTQQLILTLAAGGTGNVFSGPLYFSLTTAQGAAATADVYVVGDILPHA